MKPRRIDPNAARIAKLERQVRALNVFVGIGILIGGLFAIGAMLVVVSKLR